MRPAGCPAPPAERYGKFPASPHPALPPPPRWSRRSPTVSRCAADLLDGVHRVLGCGLDAVDLLTDLAGRFCRLLGERLDLGSHHRKTAAGFAGARRLDGGIER